MVAVKRRNRDGLSVDWMPPPPNLVAAVVDVAVAARVAGMSRRVPLVLRNSRPSQRPSKNDPSPFVS